MKHSIAMRVGPIGFRVGADWRLPITQLADLYRDYPQPHEGIPHFTVRLEARPRWRRFIRPNITLSGDYIIPDALPLPLAQGLLASEMAMNLQMALGQRHYLLLHAATVEREGKVLILTGESGSGKSTLAALLSERDWRLLGDEFALIETVTGFAWPFPRPVSLKNASIAEVAKHVATNRFGPLLTATPKGDVRHLIPNDQALGGMDTPALPALILFPRFGSDSAVREMGASEVFIRLTQASTNYVALGDSGYRALTSLVTQTPARAFDFPDTATGLNTVARLWNTLT